MTPKPYNKYDVLDRYCREEGLSHENVVFLGDDYGMGGNDESVFVSNFPCISIGDYRTFPQRIAELI